MRGFYACKILVIVNYVYIILKYNSNFHVQSRNLTYIHRMTNQLHYVEHVLHWDLWHCSPFRSNIDHHI